MRIVIVGDGKVGVTLTERLAAEGHDIVIVDHNEQVLRNSIDQIARNVPESHRVRGVLGNGASLEVQKRADVAGAHLLIAATSMDEVNILCCILGRKLGVRHTIARVRNPEYTDQLGLLKDELALSMTINPERAAAMEILNLLRFPAALRRDTFAKGRVEIVELKIHPDSPLNGRCLSELPKLAKGASVLICAVIRGQEIHIPTGDFRLCEGDKIKVTGTLDNLTLFTRKLKIIERRIRSVTLIGASKLAYYLTESLIADGTAVKIIEIDPARCAHMATALPQAVVLCADGSRPSVLNEEGFDKTDAVVSLTDIDEENIVISMYAKHCGIPKVITKVNSIEYNAICQNMGIESVVSPKNIVCSDIVRYVRAMQNTADTSSVVALHRLVEGSVDALEFTVASDTPHQNETLRDLRLKPNVLISSINRGGKIIIPGGNDVLRKGDSVVVVTTADRMYSSIDSIFA